jgi:hypothetical protein
LRFLHGGVSPDERRLNHSWPLFPDLEDLHGPQVLLIGFLVVLATMISSARFVDMRTLSERSITHSWCTSVFMMGMIRKMVEPFLRRCRPLSL